MDTLVVGSGVAGCSAALAAARHGRVMLVSKGSLPESNTRYAQGGIAAALGPEDAPALHFEDTMVAGAGLCDAGAVRFVVERAPGALRSIAGAGMVFDAGPGDFRLGREGGHSRARIAHSGGDATGAELERALLALVKDAKSIRCAENLFLLDLLDGDGEGVLGGLFCSEGGDLRVVRAGATVLATGGACRLYRESTNSPGATGDGMAAAYRAGAVLRDMEFVQFHPTVLYAAGAARFLITEAVRGAGARLVDRAGRGFMDAVHPQGDLAPRDVVVRGILRRLAETGDTHVFLDMTHLDPGEARRRFPGVFKTCSSVGLDPGVDPIPVRPSAHYFIGGVRTDLDGATNLPGLYACGEAASSGLHGANRLASNSLLEGLVLGERAGDAAGRSAATRAERKPAAEALASPGPAGEGIDVEDAKAALRSLMGRRAGPERDGPGLEDAVWAIDGWARYVLGREFRDRAGWELQNMLLLSRLLVDAAGRRTESRGTHRRSDFPASDDLRWRSRIEFLRGAAPAVVPLGEAAP
ncbi:MAG: L-aspartate oxidase [Planctomycetes bacterium]|nr:L-aspartate oxidase [Planctomycetota bacterium]